MEKITFKSPDQIREENKKERLLSEGGIYYEKIKSTEDGPESERAIINILGVEVETYASEEDIQQLKEEIILSNLDQTLLRKTAECYKLKQPILFEGDPGAGKTFLFEKFIEMVYGKGCPIDTLVGSPRTSELDILGHWAPRGDKGVDKDKYDEEIKSYQKSEGVKTLSEEFNENLSSLNEKLKTGVITDDDFETEFSQISTEFTKRQKDLLVEHFSKSSVSINDSDWEFKQGALLRAYAGRDGKGNPLIVDEFNIIPSNYQQIFLQIGGQGGGLSEKVSFWGNGGKTSYKRGPETALFFASNFPEKTEGRSEVVAPMSDRLVWTILSDKEYQEKKRAIKQTAGGRLQNRKTELFKLDQDRVSVPVENGIQWDKVLNEKLGEQIADIVDLLDDQFVKNYSQIGDKLSINGETRKRTQKLEFSSRNAMRLYSFLDKFQVRNEKTGIVDFTETLKKGYEMYYISRLSDPDMQKKGWKLFDELLVGDTGKIEFELGRTMKQKVEYIELGKKIGTATTRKDILDFYVKKLENPLDQEEQDLSVNKLEEGNIFDKWLAWSKDDQVYIPENELAQDIASRLKDKIQKEYETSIPVVFVDTDEKYKKYINGGLKNNEIKQLGIDSILGDTKDSLLRYRMLCLEQNSAFSNKVHGILETPDYLEKEKIDDQALTDILNKFISGDLDLAPEGDRMSVVLSDRQLYDHFDKLALTLENTPELEGTNFVLAHVEAKGYESVKDKWGYPTGKHITPGWNSTNRHDYKQTFSKLLTLLQSGFSDPIILSGFMSPEMILNSPDSKRDIGEEKRLEIKKQMEDLFSYKNVKFVQLPFTPNEIKDAILEIKNLRDGTSEKNRKI